MTPDIEASTQSPIGRLHEELENLCGRSTEVRNTIENRVNQLLGNEGPDEADKKAAEEPPAYIDQMLNLVRATHNNLNRIEAQVTRL